MVITTGIFKEKELPTRRSGGVISGRVKSNVLGVEAVLSTKKRRRPLCLRRRSENREAFRNISPRPLVL